MFYVTWNGGSCTAKSITRACKIARDKAWEFGYASVRQSILDGYRVIAEYRK